MATPICSPAQVDADNLARRGAITERLAAAPYDAVLYLRRAAAHTALGYPDLGAGDAYRALLLCDDLDGGEYEEQARDALEAWTDRAALEDVLWSVPAELSAESLAEAVSHAAYRILSTSLLAAGCLHSAATFAERGLRCFPDDGVLPATRKAVDEAARKRLRVDSADVIPTADLPDLGSARRELYPWNAHETDRYAPGAIAELNARLRVAAPKCAVRVATLPVLQSGEAGTCSQLGVFATEDIAPGEKVLEEYSLITASNTHKGTVCDACSSELDPAACVPCDECDAAFCSAFCRDQAAERYHPAVCDREDFDSIGKDPDPTEADHSLYLLLLGRVLAIAAHAECHPLDVPEVKYLWGDFTPSGAAPSLPFTFKYSVAEPLRLLEAMDIDIYANPGYDTWVMNTLYAKFRGVASARKTAGGAGGPDVAAVHPLWCLANHDCDPNVSWEWGGRIVMTARTSRLLSEPGLRAGDEVLNHYCDLNLPVKERREWASGPLGGDCMCARCVREAAEAEASA